VRPRSGPAAGTILGVPSTRDEAEESRLEALTATVQEMETRLGPRSPEVQKARRGLADAYRESLRERGMPYTVPVDVGVRTWVYADPVVVQTEGAAILVARPDPGDQDQRLVVFRWQHCAGAFLGPPSEEGHHLLPIPEPLIHEWYVEGRTAEVCNSPWSSWWLSWGSARARYRHFAMLFQDSVFHAFAESVDVERLELKRAEIGQLLSDPGVAEQLTRPRDRPSGFPGRRH